MVRMPRTYNWGVGDVKTMFNSVFGPGVWRHADSQISELPQPNPEASSTVAQFLLLAGGLALVLSRCPPSSVRRDFSATDELYRLLRKELRRERRTSATAEMLLDAAHECSEHLDPASRRALRHCLEARRVFEARRRGDSRPATASAETFSGFVSEHAAMAPDSAQR